MRRLYAPASPVEKCACSLPTRREISCLETGKSEKNQARCVTRAWSLCQDLLPPGHILDRHLKQMASKRKKLSREEILQKKREAERLRYQRKKNDPQMREEMRIKEKLKYERKKEKGLRKLAKDMTSREHRAALKKWREHCAAYRAKQKDATVALNTPRGNMLSSDQGSPCSSAGCNTSVSIDFPSNQIPTVTAINSHRRRQAKKRREKVNKEKDEKIEALKKKVDKYRKIITRLQNRSKKNKADTTNTKMQKMLNEPGGRKEVVKKALFSDVLNEQLKENYSNLKCIKDKQIFTKVLSGVRLQKYRRCIPRDCGVLYRGVQSTKRYNTLISYQTFCRLRPFWVVRPSTQNRDTCLCVTHSNLDMKLRALYDAKIIAYNNYQKLLEQLCCDRYNENCLSRRCLLCKNRLPKYKEFNDKRIIKYKMWVQEKQEIIDLKTKKPKIVTKHLKMVYNGHPRQIISQLHTDLEKFFVHQYSAINHLKQNLQDDDVLIHIDFSENYYTKYAEEIQAFHFGGSRAQLSLHTVVVYLKGTIHSYCTISDNMAHSPAAIWVHLGPIFQSLPCGIKHVHFLSDGPVTQYRNKTMFFMMATKLPQDIPGIEQFTWNYTESGLGKGAPDGVGATYKRTADFVVNAGGDINNIEQFVQCIQERCPNITCITIDSQDIQEMSNKLQQEAFKQKGFKGTLNVQVQGSFLAPFLTSQQTV
ncbi:unnamed protein product [Acanthoscelides obtectus]|uniref:Uncharacterized protein n=1 Tax=Acanthoscelides obtectus TaxID=200917 RepID=A0A9P0K2Y2_ACAOB|nr:unnamed protein product [Acanthoscelides obtectus]CAK1629103.1 hypothetical protein AOBTE_LOCUS5580 [Acanthoscelides obtectus]